jgi:biopolymer transport protein ExbB
MNILSYLVQSLGFIFGPLLLLDAIILAVLIGLLAVTLRQRRAVPDQLLRRANAIPPAQAAGALADLGGADGSLLGQMLAAGAARLRYGLAEARHAVANVAKRVRAAGERRLCYLRLLAVLSPLLGLLGTLFGIGLGLLAASSGPGGLNAAELTRGIGYSLVVTMHGLFLCLVAVFFYAVFKNRLNRVLHQAGEAADDLLTRVHFEAPVAT